MNSTTEKANTFLHNDVLLNIRAETYLVNFYAHAYIEPSVRGQICIRAKGSKSSEYPGEAIATLTVALSDVQLAEREIILNLPQLGNGALNSLIACGLLEQQETTKLIPSGYNMYPVRKLTAAAYAWVQDELAHVHKIHTH